MDRILQMATADLRMILREQVLWFFLIVVPALQFCVARWLLPWGAEQFPVVEPYLFLILMLMVVQVVSSIGFVIASMLLDERDEGMFPAIRSMPVGLEPFIFYRLSIATAVAIVFSFFMLQGSGLIALPLGAVLISALLFALTTPIVALAMTIFSQNKVEGLAVYKGLSFVLVLPAAAFFISSWFSYALGIVPVYWTYQYLDVVSRGGGGVPELMFGIVLHGLAVVVLYRLFRRRVLEL